MDNSTMKQQQVLTSLQNLDELRSNEATNVTRNKGNNLDVLTATLADGAETEIVLCHLSGLFPFTQGSFAPHLPMVFESAAAVALAAHHLNIGDGSIVKEVEGLNDRCQVRFTTEFTDTQVSRGVALNHVIASTNRQPGSRFERLPCAFIGAFGSSISIPTSILTGLRGFLQVSGVASSESLDDKTQYPLFARTMPSDPGIALAIISYLRDVLHVTHLAVIHGSDPYTLASADSVRIAAEKHAPDMHILQISIGEGYLSMENAVSSLKNSQFRFVYAVLHPVKATHDKLLLEAYRQGVAGTGLHNWLFYTSFDRVIRNRELEKRSELRLAYRGVGVFGAANGVSLLPNFDKFATKMEELAKHPEDLAYLYSLFPAHDHPNYKDNFPPINFLSPMRKGAMPFLYDATIALGLAACTAAGDELVLNGQDHFNRLVETSFTGTTGDIVFDHITGTRLPNSTAYTIVNFIDEEVDNEAMDMVRFKAFGTAVFQDGKWKQLQEYIFNDGTTNIPADLPPPQVDENYLHPGVRAGVLILFGSAFALALGFVVWTERHKKERVVLASQPFFLYTICAGTVILSSTIIPLSIDGSVASLDGCSIACNALPWLLTLGFSVTFSALFTKTYRVNKLLNSPNKLKRIIVTKRDAAIPMVGLLSVNILVLSLMTALATAYWEIVVDLEDEFGRPSVTYGQCSSETRTVYLSILGAINFSALCCAVFQAYRARHLSTEFAESQYIFMALLVILLALFVGGPVLLLARDNANAFVFVASAIIFVSCCSILLLLFLPKRQYLKKLRKETNESTSKSKVHISGLFSLDDKGCESNYLENTEEFIGMKVLTTKSLRELVEENDELKRRLVISEERQTPRSSGDPEKAAMANGDQTSTSDPEIENDTSVISC